MMGWPSVQTFLTRQLAGASRLSSHAMTAVAWTETVSATVSPTAQTPLTRRGVGMRVRRPSSRCPFHPSNRQHETFTTTHLMIQYAMLKISGPNTCFATEWRCLSDGRCIPLYMLCDGTFQCSDLSDERFCEPLFKCFSTIDRLPMTMVCDGISQCPDGSDEFNCNQRVGK